MIYPCFETTAYSDFNTQLEATVSSMPKISPKSIKIFAKLTGLSEYRDSLNQNLQKKIRNIYSTLDLLNEVQSNSSRIKNILLALLKSALYVSAAAATVFTLTKFPNDPTAFFSAFGAFCLCFFIAHWNVEKLIPKEYYFAKLLIAPLAPLINERNKINKLKQKAEEKSFKAAIILGKLCTFYSDQENTLTLESRIQSKLSQCASMHTSETGNQKTEKILKKKQKYQQAKQDLHTLKLFFEKVNFKLEMKEPNNRPFNQESQSTHYKRNRNLIPLIFAMLDTINQLISNTKTNNTN